jgi:small conductance mechanosensitive channel
MNIQAWWTSAVAILTVVGFKIVGAIVLYMVGRWLIGFGVTLMSRILTARNFDATLQRYLSNILSVALNVILVVAILGYFGVQTTTFAALVVGLGLAIGAAWSGLLANFAAGAFLIIFRPYKVGDYVLAGTVEGTVGEIGLFNTTIVSPDNVTAIVANSKVSSEIIRNFSTNPYRRVERTAQLAFGVNPIDAIARLKTALAAIPNVMQSPAPDVEILDFNERGTVLAVRPYCHTDHYWQVYFDTNRLIAQTFGAAAYPAPFVVEELRAGSIAGTMPPFGADAAPPRTLQG